MKTFLRIAAAVVGLVVLVFGLLALYFSFVFDPNDYRDRLATQVKAQTGRDLVIAGDMGVSVFPWLGIEVADVSLGNAPGFGDEPFARVAEADARVRLMPLLRKEIEIDRVVLRGLQLNLQRDKEGRTNWEDLGRDPGGAQQAPDPSATPAGDAAAGIGALAIGGIDVESARVQWDDRQNGVRYTASDLNLKTGSFRPGERFPLSLDAQVASSAPALEGRFELDSDVTVSADQKQYALDGLDLRFNGRGAGLPAGAADLRLTAKVAADLAQETLAIDDLVVTAYAMQANATIQGKSILSDPQFSGPLEIRDFSVREMLKALGKPAPPTADPQALTRASLKGRIEAGGGRTMLEGLDVRLDDSRLTGLVGIADREKGTLRADLTLDAIDLDRYLPPRDPNAPAQVATPGAAAASAEPEGLRTLELQGRLRVGQLKLRGLQIADIDANARATGGVMRLHPIGAALYQGRYTGNISLDARGRALRVSLDEALQGIQIGPLLRDLNGKPERLTGRGELKVRVQGSGSDADAITRTLDGTAEFRFSDGAVKGVNIARFLREAEARLKGQPVPPASGPEQTDFSELSGSLRFANGVARNDDLAGKSPLLRVTGKGSADLVRETIDYVVLASVVGTLTGQGGKEIEGLRGLTVPIRVTGSFEQPAYALDAERLFSENVKGQAREKLEQRIGEELQKQQIDPRLREGLKGLFR